MKELSDICTIGAGYLGVPFSALISHHNNLRVTIVEKNKDRLKTWRKGPAIDEPGLMSMRARLNFTGDIEGSIKAAKIIFIAVNSRSSPDPKYAECKISDDLDAVISAIKDVSVGHKIVVIKSTISCERAEIISRFQLTSAKASFTILTNPEFHAQGNAIKYLQNPEHLVLIGSSSADPPDKADVMYLKGLYSSWVKEEMIKEKSWETVALVKLASNAIRAQRISTANALSTLCEKTDGVADITEISSTLGDLGIDTLEPGPGFGGPCLARDTMALVDLAAKVGLKEISRYWKGVFEVNEDQQERVRSRILAVLESKRPSLKIDQDYSYGPDFTVCVLGPSFKAGSHDLRKSVSVPLIKELLREGFNVTVYQARMGLMHPGYRLWFMESGRKKTLNLWSAIISLGQELRVSMKDGELSPYDDITEAVGPAQAVVVMNRDEEYSNLDWKQLAQGRGNLKVVFDACNCLPHKTLETLENLGIEVVRLGGQVKRTSSESSNTAP